MELVECGMCVCDDLAVQTETRPPLWLSPLWGGRLAALSNLSIQAPSLSFHHHHPSSLYRSLTSPPFPRQACTIISQCLSHPQSLCLSLITDMWCLIQLRDFSAELPLECRLTHTQAHIHTHHTQPSAVAQGICYLRQSCRVNVSTELLVHYQCRKLMRKGLLYFQHYSRPFKTIT